jgi:hypothetical protein
VSVIDPNIDIALLSYADVHGNLGHANEAITRSTSQKLKIPISSGKAHTFDDCASLTSRSPKLPKIPVLKVHILVTELVLISLQPML